MPWERISISAKLFLVGKESDDEGEMHLQNPKIAMVILVMALMIAGALNVYSASFAMMGYGKGI